MDGSSEPFTPLTWRTFARYVAWSFITATLLMGGVALLSIGIHPRRLPLPLMVLVTPLLLPGLVVDVIKHPDGEGTSGLVKAVLVSWVFWFTMFTSVSFGIRTLIEGYHAHKASCAAAERPAPQAPH